MCFIQLVGNLVETNFDKKAEKLTIFYKLLLWCSVCALFSLASCICRSRPRHTCKLLFTEITKQNMEKSNQNQSLLVTIARSHFLKDDLDCSSSCIGDTKCLSYNIAKSPDSNGIYICEVLATDMYRAKDRLRANSSFHHFSPMVSGNTIRRRSEQFSFV